MPFLILFLASLPLFLLDAWVLFCLWGWFVVPLGVEAIGQAHALGLALCIRYAVFDQTITRQEAEDIPKAIGLSIGSAFFKCMILAIGSIVHAIM